MGITYTYFRVGGGGLVGVGGEELGLGGRRGPGGGGGGTVVPEAVVPQQPPQQRQCHARQRPPGSHGQPPPPNLFGVRWWHRYFGRKIRGEN